MGAFETKSVSKQELPEDIPDATEAQGSASDGAIYRSASGQRFRLRHARWVPVMARKPKATAKAK